MKKSETVQMTVYGLCRDWRMISVVFLAGLNKNLDEVRGCILGRRPLQVFS